MRQWRTRSGRGLHTPEGFIAPCEPILSEVIPIGSAWIHEIKYDGYRLIARRDGERVRLWSRSAKDWSGVFTGITLAIWALPVTSVVIDGEAVVFQEDGHSNVNALRSPGAQGAAWLVAFDLLMLDGVDLRRAPLSERRRRLAGLLRAAPAGLRFSEHVDDGEALFRHACGLRLEGIVSKQRNSPYLSGRHQAWRKVKCADGGR